MSQAMKEKKKSLKPELTSSKQQALNWHTPFLVSLTFNYEKSFLKEVTVISHLIASKYQDILMAPWSGPFYNL